MEDASTSQSFVILEEEENEEKEVIEDVDGNPEETGNEVTESFSSLPSPSPLSPSHLSRLFYLQLLIQLFSGNERRRVVMVVCCLLLLMLLSPIPLWKEKDERENSSSSRQPPNIILVLLDDLGWSDGSYHEGVVSTPNLEWFATQSIELTSMYSQPICSPSRAAALTGRYPIRYGLQSGVITPASPSGLFLNETILPQVLKRLGYKTHLFGKWHLGFFQRDYIPTRRGFDTHTGFWLGEQSYYTHSRNGKYSFQHNETVLWGANNTFSDIFLLTDLKKLLHDYGKKKKKKEKKKEEKEGSSSSSIAPFFIAFWPQLVHAPYEVPAVYSNQFPPPSSTNSSDSSDSSDSSSSIDSDAKERTRPVFESVHKGMVKMMDDLLGDFFSLLKETGFWDDNLIVIIQSDNGGPAPLHTNWPLRGGKTTLWEGGVRVPSWIYASSDWLPESRRGTKHNGIFHAADWFTTLVSQAMYGSEMSADEQFALWSSLPELDGLNIFPSLQKSQPSPRSEVLLNIDPLMNVSAIRSGDWKLILGVNSCQVRSCGWYSLDYQYEVPFPPSPVMGHWLFNISDDPTEHRNLILRFPEVAKKLKSRIGYYQQRSVAPWLPQDDPQAYVQPFKEVWGPWK